ncbi:MAG: ATP phosphoribosyltransferase [Proteobacteria bacterium]|nr:ATP phosphoribosyltransferase [Pseudomonadota bacterium]
MTASSDQPPIRLGLPKGRMQEEVVRLLADAGIRLAHGPREYRPRISLEGYEVKFLKPQNMVEMLQEGSRDIGFSGADWVAELDLDLVELLDTGLNPIRLVAATTAKFLEDGEASDKPFVVATEFANLTRAWLEDSKREGRILRAFGATEVFPPEDADYIVDVTATGATLEANDLIIVDELMTSSTRLYANPKLLEDAGRRDRIERFVMVLRAVLEARKRVMVEVNVPADRLDELIKVMPCMREPTVSSLNAGKGYAVKAAVPREVLAQAIPEIKACGGTDIVVTEIAQIVP